MQLNIFIRPLLFQIIYLCAILCGCRRRVWVTKCLSIIQVANCGDLFWHMKNSSAVVRLLLLLLSWHTFLARKQADDCSVCNRSIICNNFLCLFGSLSFGLRLIAIELFYCSHWLLSALCTCFLLKFVPEFLFSKISYCIWSISLTCTWGFRIESTISSLSRSSR